MIRISNEKTGVKVGLTYGKLEVIGIPFAISRLGDVWRSDWFCVCECQCGTIKVNSIYNLVRGAVKSCGCLRKEQMREKMTTHGLCKHPLYWIWKSMIQRCKNPKSISYRNYGGRGIAVCGEWINSFEIFYLWAINKGWKAGLEIDRINNNGNYEPENCHFVTPIVNARNKRNNRIITAFGETKTLPEWAEDERCNVSYKILNDRIQRGKFAPEYAITKPVIRGKLCT